MPNESPDSSDDSNEKIGSLERSSTSTGEQPDMTDGMADGEESESPVGSYEEPDGSVDDDLDIAEVSDFFEKKGAAEILAQLADGPKRFGEIDDALVVSHGTISTRLTKGAKLGIWAEYISYPEDGGKIKLYELESSAKRFAAIAEDANIRQTTEQLREANEKHAAAVSNFQEKVQLEEPET